MKYEIGDEVYWTDPDEGTCSAYGVVTGSLKSRFTWGPNHPRLPSDTRDDIYSISLNDGGGEVEAFEHELS